MSLVVIGSHSAHAAITSYDYIFVSNDQYASDFYSRLNSNFSKSLTGGINSISTANVADDTLTEADMVDEINPRIRTYEGAACEFVSSGLLPVTGASLTQNTSAGTAYPRGFRINKASATAHSYTASKWTWVDIDQNGDFQYSEGAIGAATPSVAANSIRLARVSSDTSTILSVQDLRKTSCTNGPFSSISDASNEATLADILVNGNGGWENGFQITTKDSHSVFINPGSAYINGEYRTVAAGQQTTVDGAVVASPANGTSGIDTGALAANTNYYVYGVADFQSTSAVTGILSTSTTAPTGATNSRRLGEVSTDASAVFTTADAFSVSYQGKIVQLKRFETGATKTGTTIVPADDTIPQITEGDTYMVLPFTPISSTDKLKIDVVFNYSEGGQEVVTTALCLTGTTNCLAAASSLASGTDAFPSQVVFTHYMTAGTTAQLPFIVKAGDTSGGTTRFNGKSGGRLYGGANASSITITEYAQ